MKPRSWTALTATVRRAVPYLFALLALVAGTRPAHALERYAALRLSPQALGSTARASVKAADGTFWVAGSEVDGAGLASPVVWQIVVDPQDPTGNTTLRFGLPAPSGSNAQAMGVALLEGDPDRPIIAGSINDASGRPHAAVWTRTGGDAFANTWFDDTASVATAVATSDSASGETAFCGRYRLPNGDWHACIWRRSDSGFVRRDLGTLGGPNSEANALLQSANGGVWRVAGSAQRPDGRWIASLMEEEGIFYYIRALPTPANAESRARCLIEHDGEIRIGGEILAGGRSRGTLWSRHKGENAVPQPVPAPSGLNHNRVLGLIVYGTEGNDTLALGDAWNNPAAAPGAGALLRSGTPPLAFKLDALRSRTETVDNNETITIGRDVTPVAAGGIPDGAYVGQLRAGNSGASHAALFVPIDVEVPTSVVLPSYSRIGPDIYGNLWNADGESVQVRSLTVGAAQTITVGAAFDSRTSAGGRAPGAITLSSRLRQPARSSAPATMEVQVYSSVQAEWITVGAFEPTRDFEERTFAVDNPEAFASAPGGPIRCRLIATTFGRGVLEVDLLEMQTVPVAAP